MQLGEPLINVEMSDTQVYSHISDAIELYTKYSGYTEEYLVFNSKIYQRGVGIRVGDLVSTTPEMFTSQVSGLSAGFDYDMNSFRRVVDCFSFDYGEATGINTLFTMEQALANQTYFNYALGNYGFDLTSWEVLKDYVKTRTKVLAMIPYFRFNPRTQILQIIPEPHDDVTYVGVVGCYIEKPIKDLVCERFVQKYALALAKISTAHVRGKYSSTALAGGGSVNANDYMQQGIAEKTQLENEIREGYGDNAPAAGSFFLG